MLRYGYNMHFLNCSHNLSPLFSFFSLLVLVVYNLHVFKPDTVNKGEGGAV